MKLLAASIQLAAAAQLALDTDTAAPVVTSFTYGPSVVSVGSTFSATMTVTDESGVDRVIFEANPPAGLWFPCTNDRFELINGTAYDGTWKIECVVPEGTPNQKYSINYDAYDTAGNSAFKNYRLGFSVTGGPAAEYDGPVISKVTYPSEVTAGNSFTAHLSINDASGVSPNCYMAVRETDGSYVGCTAESMFLESGTTTNGVWAISCLMPLTAPNSGYYLEIHVNDVQKNPTDRYEYDAFTLNGGDAKDTTKPIINEISFSDSSVEPGQTLTVTAQVGDAETGVDHVEFHAIQKYFSTTICKGSMDLKSGDMFDGTWTFACTIPDGTDYLVYAAEVYAYDKQNNQGYATASFNVVAPE
jgi:hypothetical protein